MSATGNARASPAADSPWLTMLTGQTEGGPGRGLTSWAWRGRLEETRPAVREAFQGRAFSERALTFE